MKTGILNAKLRIRMYKLFKHVHEYSRYILKKKINTIFFFRSCFLIIIKSCKILALNKVFLNDFMLSYEKSQYEDIYI